MAALRENVDAEARFLAERIRAVAGSRVDQIFGQPPVPIENLQRDHFGLKRRQLIDWRIDRDRRRVRRTTSTCSGFSTVKLRSDTSLCESSIVPRM